jgi:hypothetical protein
MAVIKRIAADTLLDLCAATLRDEIVPHLGPGQRYAAAMIAKALEIARREIAVDVEAPMWALLDELYEPGEGSPKQLARDIRTGDISELKNPGLASRLLKVIEAELAIVDPRMLPVRS